MYNSLNFSDANILVIGDVMLDKYWQGSIHRISPEAPVPVVSHTSEDNRVGGAGNVATNIAALGANVTLLGITGKDNDADRLIAKLKEYANLSHHLVADPEHHTISKLRVLVDGQQMIRVDKENGFSDQARTEVFDKFSQIYQKFDVIIVSDYHKGSITAIDSIIELANEQSVKVLIDPKGRNYKNYRGAFAITPNAKEFAEVAGTWQTMQELENKMENLLEDYSWQALLVTRGAEGISLITDNKTIKHFPTTQRTVYDVSGAGDTVIATFACIIASIKESMITHKDINTINEAVQLANIAAGIVVGKVGTAMISREELQQQLAHQHLSKQKEKLKTQPELVNYARIAKESNYTIAFTNGCFDLLHAGHVDYLKKASELADFLIVAINSDSSVSRLKGKSRPINSLENRLTVLNALECIDALVVFGDQPDDNDTPIKLIEILKPNVLIKGADYAIDDIVGADLVQQYGGEVKTVEFIKDLSTTSIINKVNK